jgi:TonB family protein
VEIPPLLTKILEEDHRAYVTLEGRLFGPRPLEPDDPRLPDKWSASYRMRETTYGYGSAFRTRFLVTRIDAAARVPDSTPSNWVRSRPGASRRDLLLRSADILLYPDGARRAGLEGEVEVEVTLKGGKVAATHVVAGDRALAAAAIGSIQTWTFDPEIDKTFTTRFVYVLEHRFGEQGDQKVELHIPSLVRITAPRNGW